MTKIRKLRHFFLVGALCFISFAYTGAYFSDNVGSSGNSIAAGSWTPGPAKITEVFYNPLGPVADTGREWIEITNTGPYTVDLDGYVLHFDGTGTHDFIFPDFSLLSGAKAVVHVRASGTNSSTDLYWTDTNGINMGDSYGSVGLFKSLPKDDTTIRDFVQYGARDQDGEPKAVLAGIWADNTFVPVIAEGHSMELISTDNNQVSDWQDQISPNPGS